LPSRNGPSKGDLIERPAFTAPRSLFQMPTVIRMNLGYVASRARTTSPRNQREV